MINPDTIDMVSYIVKWSLTTDFSNTPTIVCVGDHLNLLYVHLFMIISFCVCERGDICTHIFVPLY